jgi:hypothetical protein
MRIKYISTLLMFVIGFIAIGCASISDYLVGTPLIASISNNKEISRVVKEPIVISGSYEVSYLIPTNHLSTPSDIVLNSSGEIFVS